MNHFQYILMKTKKKQYLFLFIINLLLLNTISTGNNISLIKNGKSNYSIIISPIAINQEQIAAKLLQEYVYKISSFSLPIKYASEQNRPSIFIKQNSNYHPDGYSIHTKGKDIYIEGGNRKGCIYAVISLLEKYMGCKYYSSTYQVIPRKLNIVLPEIDISDAPKNDCRIVNISDKIDEDFLNWNRLNTIDEYFAKGYYVHTFNKLVPWQVFFKPHPEYFAFMNGKRIIDQLCLSNPDVLKLTLAKLEHDIKEQPDKLYWSVSQNDNFSYCQCENCKKIIEEEKSPAGPVVRFVNEVAKYFSDKIISTLAYQFSRPAPVITKPLDNVQVMLCTIELNRKKPIEDEISSQSFVKDISDWGKICKRIYLWDYTIDFANTVSPFPNLHVLQPNIQFFSRQNVKAHFQQSNISTGQEFSELKLYLISRLLWNSDANEDEITNEFLNGYYGKAAKWIKKYIDQLQAELLKSNDGLDIYEHPTSHQNTFLSADNIIDYNTYFNQAEKAVKNDSEKLNHVKVSRLPLYYAMMEIGKNDMFGKRGWYRELNGDFIGNKSMTDLLEEFYSTCKQANVKQLNESGLSPKDYYESSLRFIDIQVKGNSAFRKKMIAQPLPSKKYSNGDKSFLTNGVRGANDYKVHWLGWEGDDFTLTLDLEKSVLANKIEISSLWDAKSWILHPAEISCFVSDNGKDFVDIGKIETKGNQEKEDVNRIYSFNAHASAIRFVKFEIKGTNKLFNWHPSAGGKSWVFIDEIVVK